MSKQDDPKIGAPAPDFTLKDGNGEEWRLSANRGKVVVLLFYPGDETPDLYAADVLGQRSLGRLLDNRR